MKKPIHIAIAEDHLLVRQGLVALLGEYEDINLMFDVSNGKELMQKLKRSKPDILLLDIEMPVMNGRQAIENIQLKYPQIKVIIVSMHFEDAYILEFIKKGARSFLPKNCDIDKIVEAIRSVHTTGHYFDPKVSLVMAKQLTVSEITNNGMIKLDLTDREINILRFMCMNKTNREIAQNMALSVRTVEGHRLHIMKKTNCKTIQELYTMAVQNGLIKSV